LKKVSRNQLFADGARDQRVELRDTPATDLSQPGAVFWAKVSQAGEGDRLSGVPAQPA